MLCLWFAKIPSSGIQDETVPPMKVIWTIYCMLNLLLSENIKSFLPCTFKLSMNGMDTLLMLTQRRRRVTSKWEPLLAMLMMCLLSALGPTLTLHVGDGQIHRALLLLGIMASATIKSKPSGYIFAAVDRVGASISIERSRRDHHPLGSFGVGTEHFLSSLLFWWSTIWFSELLILGWSKPLWEIKSSKMWRNHMIYICSLLKVKVRGWIIHCWCLWKSMQRK